MSKDKTLNQCQATRSSSSVNVSRSQSFPLPAASLMTAKRHVLGDGISGSAMAVPPPKTSTSTARSDVLVGTTKGKSRSRRLFSKSDPSSCNVEQTNEVMDKNQELVDAQARETALLYQVSCLQQLVDSLRIDLSKANKHNEELQRRLTEMEDQHKVSLEKEKSAQLKAEKDHEENCRQLQATAEEKYLMEQQLTELQQLVKKLEGELSELKVQRDAEIVARDIQLARLKKQMADSLTDKSRERQQQLEELRKNLEKVQEEADILRSQLQTVQKSARDNCRNCKQMATKLASMQTASQASERIIKDLKDVIAQHEKLSADQTLQHASTNVYENR